MSPFWKTLILALAFAWGPVGAEDPAWMAEYRLKAVLILALPDYVNWPNEKETKDKNQPFLIGVLGLSPFQSYLDETSRGRTFRGRPIRVKYAQRLHELADCNMLFICDSEAYRLAEILNAFSGKPMLTVGDTPGYAINGTMVNLFLDQKQIRMEINLPSVKSCGLEVSPHLLKLSKIVK